jgi:hypothetical protein
MASTESKSRIRAARILTGLAVAFLLFDTAMKLLKLAPAVEGTASLGYPANSVFGIGLLEAICLAAFLVPRTRILGAILLTGYLGGAIATHVRLENPLFTHILFPTYVAALIWGGLFLLDTRVRALVSPRARA